MSSVEMIDVMGTDLSVVNAARVSYGKVADELDGRGRRLLRYLAEHQHWTPFAHPQASFRVECPIYVARQLHKHQVGLVVNEVSRRFTSDKPVFYKPVWGTRKEGGNKQGGDLEPLLACDDLDWMVGDFYQQAARIYERLLAQGVAPEQARAVLPMSTMTEFIWTGSLYAFARVCRLRVAADAQRETGDVARLISDSMRDAFPVCWPLLEA